VPGESVAVADLDAAVAIYARAAESFLG
jgi:hypothetical protein